MYLEIAIIIAVIMSIVIHEVSHGFAALLLGDETAKLAGRLTLNPIPHIDLLGTIIIPGLLFLSPSPFLFGYAKPVPFNPYNLKGRYADGMVAFAGPLSNILIAVVLAIIYQVFPINDFFQEVIKITILLNLFLAFLNLIPIPPLDGSKVVASLMPVKWRLLLREKIGFNDSSILYLILALIFLLFVALPFLVQGAVFFQNLLLGWCMLEKLEIYLEIC